MLWRFSTTSSPLCSSSNPSWKWWLLEQCDTWKTGKAMQYSNTIIHIIIYAIIVPHWRLPCYFIWSWIYSHLGYHIYACFQWLLFHYEFHYFSPFASSVQHVTSYFYQRNHSYWMLDTLLFSYSSSQPDSNGQFLIFHVATFPWSILAIEIYSL